nr:PREDICTED: CCAAT/enhancer-binding protein zeta [Latimeria chalumnae]|eukprot:XP_014342691.1 PREDICTED: CCAAT/enhancer-binding protein zeta [Latimeria chalumnae]
MGSSSMAFMEDQQAQSIGEEEDEDGEEELPGEGGSQGKASKKSDDLFTLEEVLRLGGTKHDYIMLEALDETREIVDGGKKGAMDDLQKGEVEAFIQKLNIHQYSEGLLIEKEEEPKQKRKGTKSEKKEGKKAVKEKRDLAEEGKDKGKKKPVQLNEISSTTKTSGKRASQSIFEFHVRQSLLIKPGGKWHDLEYTKEYSLEPQNDAEVAQYKSLAQKLYQQEIDNYRRKKEAQKGANSAWMKTVVTAGTLVDRMAAMTLLIQDAPVHTLHFVETLVNLIKKKGSRQQRLMALDTLKELLLSDLLPDNCKLWTFSQHSFENLEKNSSGNRDARDKRLILWYFEHQFKHQVAEFVQTLETLAHDTVAATKARALAVAHELLCNKPEQEKALLAQVVNKLGDPEYRMATKASYLLETLLYKHPSMKAVVCSEVERLLYRPNISPKAQYYAVCFLNQIVLSHEENGLANKLIGLYFSFFRAVVKKKDVESKMLSALLSGVNRAYPYAEAKDEKIQEQLDMLFKVVHLVRFNTSVQALMLLFQVMDSQQAVSDRYYTALYRKLLDPGLALCSKYSLFLNLLYKSLKADTVLRRVKAFVKRILQVSCGQTPPFICGALYLVSEILRAKPGLRVLLQEHGESEEEKFQDIDDEEEIFTDADKAAGTSVKKGEQTEDSKSAASWVHHRNLEELAKCCCSFQLAEHFHPSVVLFANFILQGDFIQYSGDPLQDFTLTRFLDRFVYRNPKQQKGKENTASFVMQPKQKRFMSNIRSVPVNSKAFVEKDESQIPVDELFFYRYYKRLNRDKPKWKSHADDESLEDVDDDEFEKILDSLECDGDTKELGDDKLDFAGNVKNKLGKDEKTENDSDFDEDLDDEEVSLGSMDEEDFDDGEDGGAFMDVLDDESGTGEGNLEEEGVQLGNTKTKTSKRKKTGEMDFAGSLGESKKKKGLKSDSVFAVAEEFGDLLDENSGSKFDYISSNAVANRDNASIRQLKWEADRDRWLRGRDVKSLIKNKKKFKGKRVHTKQKSKKQRK